MTQNRKNAPETESDRADNQGSCNKVVNKSAGQTERR